jgi:hypothetical protein
MCWVILGWVLYVVYHLFIFRRAAEDVKWHMPIGVSSLVLHISPWLLLLLGNACCFRLGFPILRFCSGFTVVVSLRLYYETVSIDTSIRWSNFVFGTSSSLHCGWNSGHGTALPYLVTLRLLFAPAITVLFDFLWYLVSICPRSMFINLIRDGIDSRCVGTVYKGALSYCLLYIGWKTSRQQALIFCILCTLL